MKRTLSAVLAVGAVALLAPAGADAAGFSFFEQGTKATGMAGAFTATADDASAMFYNPAGLAYLTRTEAYGGLTLVAPLGEFEGRNPYPGEGTREEQEKNLFSPPSAYLAMPFGNGAIGIGLMTPFGLGTEWQDKDTFSGRFISQRADLQSVSIQPTLAWKFGEKIAVGLGAEYRVSVVELERNAGTVNPFTQTVVDVAHVELTTDKMGTSWGFATGLMFKPVDGFRIGLSYRHSMDSDVEGTAEFSQISTGNAALDAVVAARFGFDPSGHAEYDVETTVAYPNEASIGFATDFGNSTVELDANWTGWNTFETLDITFPDRADLSSSAAQDYQNVWNFRLGFETRFGNQALRGGLVYDNTPQPNATVSPLLPDGDRVGYCIGWGWNGQHFGVDLAYMYLDFRTPQTKGQSHFGYNGVYDNTGHLLGLHAKYRF